MQSHETDRLVLRRLLLADDASQAQLAGELGVNPTAVYRSVSRLVKSGLVRLERSRVEMIPKLTLLDKVAELDAGIRTLREAVA